MQNTVTDLVFLEPNRIGSIPFTTSDVIAEKTENSYRSIQRTIERQLTRLEAFGRVRFEITPLQTKGGVQKHKVYLLNEEQATLLMTFLKNNDIVADFKVELVRQFYAMRKRLKHLRNLRRNLPISSVRSPENQRRAIAGRKQGSRLPGCMSILPTSGTTFCISCLLILSETTT